jgi:hypothetical protein
MQPILRRPEPDRDPDAIQRAPDAVDDALEG